jgi:TonB family protein
VQLSDCPGEIYLTFDETVLPDDGRFEPVLTAAVSPNEFVDPIRLDPTRINFDDEPPPPDDGRLSRGPIGSLLLHLLPLLALVSLSQTPAGMAPPIPIQAVIWEATPPAAPGEFALPDNPSPGNLAAEDVSEEGASGDQRSAEDTTPTPSESQPPAVETKTTEVAQSVPLTIATRDDYLAYLVTLTREHLGLLPLSVIGDRRGETVISLVVYDDGSIAHITVYQSSGYPDIDQRIEKLVAAVGKFPPVPRQFQGTAMQLELTVHFPEVWER